MQRLNVLKRSPHTLTVGPTGCGKTTLQTAIARDLWKRRGGGNVVLDPKFSSRWATAAWARDAESMVNILHNCSHYHAWVDEVKQTIDPNNPVHTKLATDMREIRTLPDGKLSGGHAVHFIATYLKGGVPPLVRTNVGRFYIFHCTIGLRELIAETGDANLEAAAGLRGGEFLVKDVMGDCRKGVITDCDTGNIHLYPPMPQKYRI